MESEFERLTKQLTEEQLRELIQLQDLPVWDTLRDLLDRRIYEQYKVYASDPAVEEQTAAHNMRVIASYKIAVDWILDIPAKAKETLNISQEE